MNLLALETANVIPTACLLSRGTVVRRWQGSPRPGAHAVLRGVREMLDAEGFGFASLDSVACGRGPGAFTGVRLGLALTQGVALGIGCPVVAVSELAALAWRTHHEHGWRRVVACLDARQGKVYWAAYECDDGTLRALVQEAIAKPDEINLMPGEWTFAGSGVPLLAVGNRWEHDSGLAPDAEAIAALATRKIARGEVLPAVAIEPAYLRNRVATPRSKRV
ncbi:MAG: tRNA (adenosine(37)-N6)-threonylcarbamoyltransferase complex dimerization subunit type 1 TsaB [Gammaproteobacteria bacterium]